MKDKKCYGIPQTQITMNTYKVGLLYTGYIGWCYLIAVIRIMNEKTVRDGVKCGKKETNYYNNDRKRFHS